MIRETLDSFNAFSEFVEQVCLSGMSPLANSMAAAMRHRYIDTPDAVAIYAQLVTGALEPTLASLAVALEVLSTNQSYQRKYKENPAGFATEAVRLATPFHFAARRCATSLKIRDNNIQKGDRVVLVLAAANRDPRRFPRPLDFQPDRPAVHVAFGRGRHSCVGAPLTNQILRSVVDAVAPRAAELPLIQVDWHVGIGMRAPVRVSVVSS
ncbi:cytochrome P450 [Streptomyces lasalocidi]